MKKSIFKSIISILLTISIVFSLSTSLCVYAASQIGYITATEPLNVRKTPSTKDGDNKLYINNVKVQLQPNQQVTVLETVDSINGDTANPKWHKVEFLYNGSKCTGYITAKYVTVYTVNEDVQMPEGIPEIYEPYIKQLLSVHPNWNFVVVDTGYNWEDLFVTTNKGQGWAGRSLVQGSYPLSYRSTADGCYNWREDKWIALDGSSWYQANTDVIKYYMDPRNFLNESTVFMFEKLSYDSSTQNIDGVTSILKGSFMDGKSIKNTDGADVTYAQAYMDAAAYANVSPYHLASRTVQEVGKNGSGSTSGNYGSYKGYYNFYNIGASSGSDPIANGLKYAKSGGSLDKNEKELCLIPWDSQYKSIKGGAYWIGFQYINSVHKQNTLYYQKFNTSNSNPSNFYHQYMTNVMAPAHEAPRMRNSYTDVGFLENNFTFIIPYYRNMPSSACQLPASNNYNPNNWLKSLDVDGNSINFDSAKTSGYTYTVASNASSVKINATTINSKAKVSGAGTVALKDGNNVINVVVTAENGSQRTYTINITRSTQQRIPMTAISLNKSSVSLFKGDSTTLTVNYSPSNTTDNKSVTWSSSNTSVANVSNGKVTAVGKGEATITAKVGSFTATCKVTVSADVKIGDIDGDSSVTIADALMIFKYKTGEMSSLSALALLAADTNISGTVELADALRIFKFKSGEIDSLYDSNGHWVKDSLGWSYLDANGRWLYNQWIKDSTGWCYLGTNGHLIVSDWVKWNNQWYYLDDGGHMISGDWIEWKSKWYYLDDNGCMVTGKQIIGGKEYNFDSNGALIS